MESGGGGRGDATSIWDGCCESEDADGTDPDVDMVERNCAQKSHPLVNTTNTQGGKSAVLDGDVHSMERQTALVLLNKIYVDDNQ